MRAVSFGFVFCAGVALLSGCSGGGGGTPISPAPTAAPTATPIPTSTPVAVTPAIERQAAQADMSAVRPLFLETQLEQGLTAQSFARKPVFARAHLRRNTTGACNNGSSFTESTSGTTTTFALDFFYDSACTKPWQTIAGQEVPTTISGGVSEAVTATDTIDNIGGAQIGYDSIAGTLKETSSQDSIAFNASFGPSAATVTGNIGADCVFSGSVASNNETCSFGALADVPPFLSYDAAATVTNSVSTVVAQNGGFTQNGSGSGTFYAGQQPPAMQLVNDGSTLTVTGSQLQKQLTETETVTTSSSATPTAMVSVTDTTDNVLVIINVAGYTITGKVENATTLAVEATFTLDINGNGTITYSNGMTGTITGFTVVS